MPAAMSDHSAARLPATTRRIGLIGHGRIGGIVARALASGQYGHWSLAAVLTRNTVPSGDPRHHTDPERFLAVPVDLYLECAGPQALGRLGEAALERADVWSVSGVALADDALRARLQATGARHGHRLRLPDSTRCRPWRKPRGWRWRSTSWHPSVAHRSTCRCGRRLRGCRTA